MTKLKNLKRVLSTLLMIALVLSIGYMPLVNALGADFDEEYYDLEPQEAEYNYEIEQQLDEVDPLMVGQGDPTIFGQMPFRIATPLRNQILSIWVGTSSSIHHQDIAHWELVWPRPYNPVNDPPLTANPPANISAHVPGATHIAFRFARQIHHNASFRFDEVLQTAISQPGLLMSQSYTSSGTVTPIGGTGMAFVDNAVFELPWGIAFNPNFTMRLSFQRNNPPSLQNLSINFNINTEPIRPPQAGTAAQLQNAINAAPANSNTTIEITNNFAIGNAIQVPANRQITLVSNNANVRTLSQMNSEQRHFLVTGRLTLGQNITLSGGLANLSPSLSAQSIYELEELVLSRSMYEAGERNIDAGAARLQEALAQYASTNRTASASNAVVSGGVAVGPGGFFTMNAGSIIEDCMNPFGGAVSVWGSGTAASTRGTFNLNGGTLRFNLALNGGAVDLDGNARMNMTSGTITGNEVFENGAGVWVGTGTRASGQGFNMTGGSIVGNFAVIDGGGIFTTDFATGYANIFTGPTTVFSQNFARGWVTPPPVQNRPAHISSASATIAGHILNNVDIIYWGHLG